MSRFQKLQSFRTHPMFGSYFKRLSKTDLEEVEQFVREREHLSTHQYALEANRFKLDQPKNMKVYSLQWALISQANECLTTLKRRNS